MSASDDALWEALAQLFHSWTGIRLAPSGRPLALSSLHELANNALEAPLEYLRRLETTTRPMDRQALIDRLVVGTTWFMRDQAGVQALVQALVGARGKGGRVRLWSAGCSTGQEPYSLAMALLEADLEPQIVATDISREALAAAQKAIYTPEQLAALPIQWRQRWTRPVSGGYEIDPRVGRCVVFLHHNLATHAAEPPWRDLDAVVCKNVLIYFERDAGVRIVEALGHALSRDGVLLLGAAERPLVWMTKALSPHPRLEELLRVDSGPPAERPPAPVRRRRRRPTRPVKVVVRREWSATPAAQRGTRPAPPGTPEQRLDPARHLELGLEHKRAGQLREAVRELRYARFLSQDDAWMPAWQLALCLEQLGDLRGAREAYRHTLLVLLSGRRSGLDTVHGADTALEATVVVSCRLRLRDLAP